MKQSKTNAMRLLDSAKIPYTPFEYATDDGLLDGISVALKTGQSPEIVFKTLVARGASGDIYVFCIPVAQELSLKAAARAAGEKSVAMLPAGDLLGATGYVHGGCSPIGMKKRYPIFVHTSAESLPEMVISGGRVGLQIKLEPKHFMLATGAKAALLNASDN